MSIYRNDKLDDNSFERSEENKEKDKEKISITEKPEIGVNKVENFFDTKSEKNCAFGPLLPPFLQKKLSSAENKCLCKRLSSREETRQIPSHTISAWLSQAEKTNLESIPCLGCAHENHFLSHCTILDSISTAIPDSSLLNGNLNALNGLHKIRQTDDASALKLEHETCRGDPLNKKGLIKLIVLCYEFERIERLITFINHSCFEVDFKKTVIQFFGCHKTNQTYMSGHWWVAEKAISARRTNLCKCILLSYFHS